MSQPQKQLWSSDYLAYRIIEPSPRRVRVKFGGEIVADSERVLLLRQYDRKRLPTYYFPASDVRFDVLGPIIGVKDHYLGKADFWTLNVGQRVAEKSVWRLSDPLPDFAALKSYMSFDWSAMDAWFEEDEEVFCHARDPYKRVDTLASTRCVRVEIAGQTVAETNRPYLLFETSLPTRYYIPADDVRLDLLDPSSLKTRCPYKGIASYWSVKIGDYSAENIVWSYPEPIPECPKIKDLLCFFNEHVDIYLDGELQGRPQTPWSA